jgi:rod shape-determining protein MreD
VRTFKVGATIIAALLLQLLLVKYFLLFSYLDLPLVVTVYFGLQRLPVLGMTVGFIAGLGGDKVSGGILGVGGFTKTLLGYVVAIASIKFPLEGHMTRLGVMAFASVANTLIFIGLYEMLRQSLPYTETWGMFLGIIGRKLVADVASAIILFTLLDRLFREKKSGGRSSKRRFND